ncbi:MAG: hypothetical protein JWO78_1581 [Micavibrio sp.]|nr:hypothetical protein [Micavibrio sp.]
MNAVKIEPLVANVRLPDPKDREIIKEFHTMGREFALAVGAYIQDNSSLFPQGTLSKKITDAEQTFVNNITKDLSNLHFHATSYDEMADNAVYYGVHLYCMVMQTEERYLESLKVSFKDVADSVDVAVSDEATMQAKLNVCEKYGFAPMARLLNLKMAA